jgi:hypothetical protein
MYNAEFAVLIFLGYYISRSMATVLYYLFQYSMLVLVLKIKEWVSNLFDKIFSSARLNTISIPTQVFLSRLSNISRSSVIRHAIPEMLKYNSRSE